MLHLEKNHRVYKLAKIRSEVFRKQMEERPLTARSEILSSNNFD